MGENVGWIINVSLRDVLMVIVKE